METPMASPSFPCDEVRPLRMLLGWTQEDMARQLGISQSLVTHWETGRREPRGPAALMLIELEARTKALRKTAM